MLGCSGSYGGAGGEACSGYLLRVGATVDLGRLRQRHASGTCRSTSRSRTSPRWCSPTATPTTASTSTACTCCCATASAPGASRSTRPEGSEKFLAVAGRPTGATRSTGTRSATATPPRSGDIDLRFSRTDHPPPTYAVEATHDGSRLIYTADTGPDWRVGAFAPGADLVLSEATYLHDNNPAPIHLSAKQAGEAARRGRGAQRLMLTHLWPHDRQARGGRRRARRRSGAVSPWLRRASSLPSDSASPPRPGRPRGHPT